jgi:transcription antitermination factor NusG
MPTCNASIPNLLPLYAHTAPDRATPSLRHRILVPLFPRYLFVLHDQADLWRPIRETPGVNAVLTSGNQIQWVRKGVVEALQAGEERPAADPPDRPAMALRRRVRVARGIFAGHCGVVTTVEHEAVVVAVLFLGQLRKVALKAQTASWEETQCRYRSIADASHSG